MTTTVGRSIAFRLLSIVGIVLAVYALYVEHRVMEQRANPSSLTSGGGIDEPFVALCDLASWARCSDVLTSESSHLFGPPNAAMGLLFYIIVLLYPSVTFVPLRESLLLAAVSFSCALTIYLGSILYQMQDFCALCVSTYVVNWTLLYFTVKEFQGRNDKAKVTKKQK